MQRYARPGQDFISVRGPLTALHVTPLQLCQMPCHAFERTFPSYGAIEHDESGRHPRMRRGRLVTLR